MGGIECVQHKLLSGRTTLFPQQAAFGTGIVKIFERAIDTVADQRQTKIIGGYFRNAVSFIED